MRSGSDSEDAFTCPECGTTLPVNDAMKASLLERGCVACGTGVSPASFTDEQAQA